jgi:DNA-binding transcriptional regulator YiaG
MTLEEEQQWWQRIVRDLRSKFTLTQFAESVGVSERTITNWQNGDRPMGMKAIHVYLMHVRLFPKTGNALPSAELEKG